MVELLCVRRWEKRNRSNFYWGFVKVCVGSIPYGGIDKFCFLNYWNISSSKFIKILSNIKSLCIILKSDNFLSKYVSIPSDKNMSQRAKYFNTPICVLFGFTLVIKLRHFDFEGHWNSLMFLDKNIYNGVYCNNRSQYLVIDYV